MKLLCSGDSIVNGFPFSRKKSFPSLVSELTKHEITVENIGMNGITSGQTARFLKTHLMECNESAIPDAVLVCCGSNDLMTGYDPAEVMSQIEKMESMAAAAGIKSFIAAAPPLTDPEKASRLWMPGIDYSNINNMLEKLRTLLHSFCQRRNIIFADIQSEYKKYARYTDGVHPTEEGYILIAKYICSILR